MADFTPARLGLHTVTRGQTAPAPATATYPQSTPHSIESSVEDGGAVDMEAVAVSLTPTGQVVAALAGAWQVVWSLEDEVTVAVRETSRARAAFADGRGDPDVLDAAVHAENVVRAAHRGARDVMRAIERAAGGSLPVTVTVSRP